MKKVFESYDFNSASEFYNYIDESFINGNGQGKKLFFEMPKQNQIEYLQFYADDVRVKTLAIALVEK